MSIHRWIRVTEAMPKPGDRVLFVVYTGHRRICDGHWADGSWWDNSTPGEWAPDDVTHWRHLPLLPLPRSN